MWVDIGNLIREKVPDKRGNVLPPDITSGSYEFRDLTNTGVGKLFEGKITYDKTYGHVAYGCGTCCGYAQPKVFYNPLGVPVAFTSGDGVNAYENCSLTWDDVSDSFCNNWYGNNTAIVTVDAYGTHTGVSLGSTTSRTLGTLDGVKHAPQCPPQQYSPAGQANVSTPAQLLVSEIQRQTRPIARTPKSASWRIRFKIRVETTLQAMSRLRNSPEGGIVNPSSQVLNNRGLKASRIDEFVMMVGWHWKLQRSTIR